MHIKTTISNHLKRATLTLLTLILTCATAWADTENVSYIDANGNTQTVTATVLTGNEGYLGTEGQTKWYVANSNISYSGGFSCSGNVNIILGDSKTMVVNGSINENGNLTIYGQSGQSGILNATNSSGYYAICCNPGNFIINGGNAANQWRTGITPPLTMCGSIVTSLASSTPRSIIAIGAWGTRSALCRMPSKNYKF